MLSAQDAGNFGSHTTEDEAIGVDDMPLADHFTCFWEYVRIINSLLSSNRDLGEKPPKWRPCRGLRIGVRAAFSQSRWVANFPQAKAMGRGNLGGLGAVARDNEPSHIAWRALAHPDINERSHQRPHHLLTKRIGFDL